MYQQRREVKLVCSSSSVFLWSNLPFKHLFEDIYGEISAFRK